MVEVRSTGHLGDIDLAGIDEIGVFHAGRSRPTHPEHAVLGLQDDLAPLWEEISNQRWHTDPQVQVRTVGDVTRDTRRNLLSR